jgi:epoxide hydrolase-like predicted phosphatase
MIKAIVFDIGGVLLRTEDHTERKKLEQKYGLPEGGADALVFNSEPAWLSTIGKAPQTAIWQNIAQTLDLSQEELDSFQKAFWSGDHLDVELVNFLKSCRPRYKTALLSNAWEGSREHFETNFGFIEGEMVDHILISAELGVAKPDYRIYDILRQRIGCEFSEIVFVDDFLHNIEAAKQLGIQALHFQTGLNVINQIKSMLESNTR